MLVMGGDTNPWIGYLQFYEYKRDKQNTCSR